jgi:outer membrane receptor protein involved in Fe transport
VWHFTAGARAFKYSYDFTQTLQGLFTGQPTPTTTPGSASGLGVNPKVVLARNLSEKSQAYLSATKGYRPGGSNPPAPVGRCGQDLAALGLTSVPSQFKQDWLWSYEVGEKSELADGRVRLNTALYYIDWKNLQQQVLLPTCGAQFTDNVGEARSTGVEMDLDALLMPGLRATVGLAFDKAKFTQSVPDAGVETGDKLLNAPDLTASTTVEYSFPLGGSRGGYARAGYDYVSGSLDTLRQTNFATGQVTPGISKGGYGLVDLRFGVTSGGWDVALYATNLCDKRPLLTETSTIGQVIPTFHRVVTLQPRTVGLSVAKSF